MILFLFNCLNLEKPRLYFIYIILYDRSQQFASIFCKMANECFTRGRIYLFNDSTLYLFWFIIIFGHQYMKYPYCVLLLVSMACLACCQLKPERLRVVDKDERLKNYLVRGNLPIGVDRKFQIQELKQNLTKLTGLERFDLVVISFLNFLTAKETKNRYIEEKFFEAHPEEGQYSTKLILGSLIDPLNYPPAITTPLQFLTSAFDIDNIESFVSELYDQVHGGGRNRIIFMHCSAGMDRTGLVAGAYKMKYLDYSMKRVIEENSRFGGERKQMVFTTLNGLKWFCLAVKGSRENCRVQSG